jgi:hypothetical protein
MKNPLSANFKKVAIEKLIANFFMRTSLHLFYTREEGAQTNFNTKKTKKESEKGEGVF